MFFFLSAVFIPLHSVALHFPRIYPFLALVQMRRKGDLFNILWILVFGFATLNILGLVTRRFEPNRNRLSFGETLAVTVVVASVGLLSWEMLSVFKILPLHIQLH